MTSIFLCMYVYHKIRFCFRDEQVTAYDIYSYVRMYIAKLDFVSKKIFMFPSACGSYVVLLKNRITASLTRTCFRHAGFPLSEQMPKKMRATSPKS